MDISKTMMIAVEALQKFGSLMVSEGFKTSPATLVPPEDVELTGEEIVAKYTENDWRRRAINRQTINKLVKEGIAAYTSKEETEVRLVEPKEEQIPDLTFDTVTYWYHPESDSCLIIQAGEVIEPGGDFALCHQITLEEYNRRTAKDQPIPERIPCLDDYIQPEIFPGIETKSKPIMSVVRTEGSEELPAKPKDRIRELETIVERVFRWTYNLRGSSRPDYDLGYSRAQMDLRDILEGRQPAQDFDSYSKEG